MRPLAISLAFLAAAMPVSAGQPFSFEIVSFRDVDDLVILKDGRKHKAYLIGLKPLRDQRNPMKQEFVVQRIIEKLAKATVYGEVVEEKKDRLGLVLMTYMHHKNDFKGVETPCLIPWGRYIYNLYYVHTGEIEYAENYDTKDDYWKRYFDVVLKAKTKR